MDNVKGVWRTVRGRRVFIAEGQDLYTAMEKSGKFKNLGKRGTYQASKNTFKNETNSEIMKSGQGTRAYNDMNKEYGLDRRDIEEQAIKNGELYNPKHNKEEAQRRMKKKYNYSRESNYDESKDKIAQYRYERYAYENNLKRFGDELEKEDYKRAKGKIDAYKKRKGATTNSANDDDSLYDSKNSSKAYSSYLEKAKELDAGEHRSWTGKEYTNDEFMEHLTDANWHTERKMIEDAKLTNKQLSYVKDNTRLSMWGAELDKKSTADLIAKAKKINSFTQKSTGDNLSRTMTPKERARSIDKANADYSKMTRQQLAEVIVDDQISRGVVKTESRDIQIKGRLKGIGASKPMSKKELLDAVRAIKK